ncbi:MAG: FAD-binding oxidoreductase [Spirochaetales bacterium]|nr:FAD-binding oxidoreductase [Spirochaetales bacterium]
MMKKQTADVVIIGGGVRGLAIAYFLSRAKVDVLLVEKRFLASGASGMNMGYVNISAKKPDFYTRFSKMSADLYPEFHEQLGGDIEYERNGSLFVAESEEAMQDLAQNVAERNRVDGLNIELLGIDELRRLEPALSPDLAGGYWAPTDGGVNPLKLTRALARESFRMGARIETGTEVQGIRINSGRIEEVFTNRITVATHVVVNAAGIHVPHISQMVGLTVPVDPERGQVVITEAMPRILQHAVGDYKQFADGQVLIGTTNEQVGEDIQVTTEMISDRVRRALRIIPLLQKAKGIRFAAALRPMPPDRLPIYQKINEINDFYVAVGHSGMTLAPITGKIFSDLITKGQTEYDLSKYNVQRLKRLD